MNKIIELVIDLEDFEFDDLGVEIMSLVDRPAIEVNWMSFKEEEFQDLDFESHVLKLASELGQPIDPEVIYVDAHNEKFVTVSDFLQGIRALDVLDGIAKSSRDAQAEERFRYAGPFGQRTFCQVMKSLNRTYSRNEITAMNAFNPGFGAGGSRTYSVFDYKGGVNCQHYWERLMIYNDANGRQVINSLGPVEGDAGKSNNSSDQSPTGYVTNNASLKFWAFSEDGDQMIITGPAMLPGQLIPRKDELGNLFHVYFSKETIKNIAKKFMADNKLNNTDVNHDENVVQENTLLESWIVEDPAMDKSKALGFDVPKGTWMVSYKINNEETWQKIKAGELNGFSVEGAFLEKYQNI